MDCGAIVQRGSFVREIVRLCDAGLGMALGEKNAALGTERDIPAIAGWL